MIEIVNGMVIRVDDDGNIWADDEIVCWVMIECGNKNCGNVLWYNGA